MNMEKNQPLLKLIAQVTGHSEYVSGDSKRFIAAFEPMIKRKLSRQSLHCWIKKGLPQKYVYFAKKLSQQYGGEMTAKEFRPDLFPRERNDD